MKKKYQITLYYHTSVTVEVEAENEQEAREKAYNKVDSQELLDGLQEDDSPDVEEITK